MNMKKMTKKVWFKEELWNVERIFELNNYDKYLFLTMKNDKCLHQDGETIPIDAILIDVNNDAFYPDTPRINKLMNELISKKNKYEKYRNKISVELTDSWLDVTIESRKDN